MGLTNETLRELQSNVPMVANQWRANQDLQKVAASIYAHWHTLRLQNDCMGSGIFDIVNEDLKNFQDILLAQKEMKFWYSSRIFGEFVVLFDRPDGTILVSADLSKVYLVVTGESNVSLGKMCQDALDIDFPKLYGPICGIKIAVTLLPYRNKIILDEGVLTFVDRGSPFHIQHALHAYRHALETDSIITELPKLPDDPELQRKPITDISDNFLGHLRTVLSDLLKTIGKYPKTRNGCWLFEKNR